MKNKRYDPPAFMKDFDDIPGQLEQWSNAVSGWTNESIKAELATYNQYLDTTGQPCQYYNLVETDPGTPVLKQDIFWNGFPRTLRLHYGQRKAYGIADQMFNLAGPRPGLPTAPPFFYGKFWESLFYRPQDEYCEWRVERDPITQKILRILMTSEPPEYWQALHGDTLANIEGTDWVYPFTGDSKKLLALYHQFVSPEVKYEDLVCHHDFISNDPTAGPTVIYKKGAYNPYNKWNTTHGIMHLSQPNNTISAEIKLGADATVLYKKEGRLLTQPDALICGAGFGGTARSSDPTIGSSVNDLARLGAWVTIQNPVGLYMHDLNTQGWTKPNGEEIDPAEYFKILRGKPGMIERAVFEVPASEGFTVSDIKIAGVPIQYGGQVTEHINVLIPGQAAVPGHFQNKPVPVQYKCCIETDNPTNLTRVVALDAPCAEGYEEAFKGLGGTFDCSGNKAEAKTRKGRKDLKPKPRKRNQRSH